MAPSALGPVQSRSLAPATAAVIAETAGEVLVGIDVTGGAQRVEPMPSRAEEHDEPGFAHLGRLTEVRLRQIPLDKRAIVHEMRGDDGAQVA